MGDNGVDDPYPFARLLARVRETKPLIHHITNYVTVNDCANAVLAIGGSPIMADSVMEAADIAAMASALVLNIGTLHPASVDAMIAAGESANHHGVPVVLDPVGAGASPFRDQAVNRILAAVDIAVIRGNVSEIRAVGGMPSSTKGVDAGEGDMGVDHAGAARWLADRADCVVAVTGSVDAISDGRRTVLAANGHSMLSRVSGTGCMCTSLVGTFVGAAPAAPFEAAVAGVLCMGIAGEIAHETAGGRGCGGFRTAIIDAISLMDETALLARGKLRAAKN